MIRRRLRSVILRSIGWQVSIVLLIAIDSYLAHAVLIDPRLGQREHLSLSQERLPLCRLNGQCVLTGLQ